MRRFPNWLLSVATCAVFLFLLCGLELVLRWASPDYFYRLYAEESSNVYSQTLGWELRPGFRGIDFGHLATVNRHGYRGREHPLEKPAGRTRVLMLGDSIAYGAGVADDETFSALLESRGPRFEVVNLAVGGYGTDQELLTLEQRGLAYQPDVVVLNFCIFSDFTDNALPSALFDARQPKPYFTQEGGALVKHDAHVRLSPLRRLTQGLADESQVYNRLVRLAGGGKPPREPGVWMDRMDAVMKNLAPAADLTFALIRRTSEVARAHGARFLVVIHPDRFTYNHARYRLLRKFCAPLLEGIPVIDLGARYHERGLAFEQFALDEPGHLTRLGHQVAAEILYAVLSSQAPPEWDYRTGCRTTPEPES